MRSFDEVFESAIKLHNDGKVLEAQNEYFKLLKKNTNNFKLYFLIGTSFLQTKNFDESIKYLSESINLNSNFSNSYNNRGIAYAEKENFNNAIDDYNRAIKLNPNDFDALLNKAIALKNIKNYDESIKYYNLCIKLNPKDHKVYNNLGNLYLNLNYYEKSKEAYNRAILLNKNFTEALSNRGDLLQNNLNDIEGAISDYKQAYKIDSNLKSLLGKIIHAEMILNNWENFEENIQIIKREIKKKNESIMPFALLSLVDEPGLHKEAAENFINKKFPEISKKDKKNYIFNKIKIGYFSADFKNHPIAHLALDIFKYHDKSKFEIYGFYHGIKNDYWTEEIKKKCNYFYDISNLTNKEAVKLIKSFSLNIALNLTGNTRNSRDDIFYNRIAPIQINYLGYPGTLGAKFYDYIIADKVVIPKSSAKYYSEKILYLKNCYQPNLTELPVAEKKFLKKKYNLPDNKFIFGCFNNSYKITPSIFSCWMEILNNCKNSILWLLQNNEIGQKNLIKEAQKKNIDKNRIIFAKKIKQDEHLGRLSLIDLFLDTFPYGAHTTAREAINMKVPIVTMMGNSFASRVAGSLLLNAGLNELVTTSIDEYAKLASEMANNNFKYQIIKKKINDLKNKKELFDNKEFTKNLENIYEGILKA